MRTNASLFRLPPLTAYIYFLAFLFLPPALPAQTTAFGTYLGSFQGVSVYSNESPGYNSDIQHFYNGQYMGIKWQCVEYVRRYTYLIKNHLIPSNYNANQFYNGASNMGLTRYANGGAAQPQVGDILCSNGGGSGHVGIISEVGSNYVKVVQQNFHNNTNDIHKQLSMTVVNGRYTISGFSTNYPIQGWLRKETPPTSAPYLSSPGNYNTVPSGSITFSWNSVANATAYRIQIKEATSSGWTSSSGFPSPMFEQNVGNNTSYTWTGAQPGKTYFWSVRGGNDAGPGPYATPRRFYTSSSGTITVTSPSSGNSWQMGSGYNIRWTDNISENVRIYLYRGSSYVQTISSNTASDGAYYWAVPTNLTAATNYRVYIRSVNSSSISDFSGYFTINSGSNSSGSIIVTSPSSGNSWQMGSGYNIRWTDNISENVSIYLYRGSSYVRTIASNTASDGAYYWAVPTNLTAATNYRIYIRSVNSSSISDFSGYFTINSGSGGSLSNDDPCNATRIYVQSSWNYTNSTNSGATATSNPSYSGIGCNVSNMKDVWFKFIPGVSGWHTLRGNAGSLNDGVMALYRQGSSCTSMSYQSCHDDMGGGSFMPEINAYLYAGYTYYIRFWGYGGTTGSFGVCVRNGYYRPGTGPVHTPPGDVVNDSEAKIPEMAQGQAEEPGNAAEIKSRAVEGLRAFPNPISNGEELKIEFQLPDDAATLMINVLDMNGRTIHSLSEKDVYAGTFRTACLINGLPPGMYFCTVQTDGKTATSRFVVKE